MFAMARSRYQRKRTAHPATRCARVTAHPAASLADGTVQPPHCGHTTPAPVTPYAVERRQRTVHEMPEE
ncbi:MAG: hypothetical protein EBR06_02900 [Acidimicrobiia bacterium]|nr:hypothetical protein [Acidimicrobiia bacterium]